MSSLPAEQAAWERQADTSGAQDSMRPGTHLWLLPLAHKGPDSDASVSLLVGFSQPICISPHLLHVSLNHADSDMED